MDSKKRVLIVNPPALDLKSYTKETRCIQDAGVWLTNWPPITLAYIAGLLIREKQFEVMVKDCGPQNIDFKDLTNLIVDYRPDIFIVSSSTPTINSDIQVLRTAKKNLPDLKTIIFGNHVSFFAKELISDHCLDFIVRGEPESKVADICLALTRPDDFNLDNIRGITFRSEGRINHNPDGRFIDLDNLPIPAWDLIDIDKYTLPFNLNKFLLVAPTRGCPYRCSFCLSSYFYGSAIRYRDPISFVDELKFLTEHYHVYDFLFWSETFTFNGDYVNSVCTQILKNRLNIKWRCATRADKVNLPVLKKMRDAGCCMVSLGIESGSQDVLDKSGKGIKKVDIEQAVGTLKKAGLEVVGHFIFGLEGEDKRTIKETIKFSRSLPLDFAQFYNAAPFPGTPLFDRYTNQGMLLAVSDWSDYSQKKSIVNLPQTSSRYLTRMRRVAVLLFYFRVKSLAIIFKQLNCKIGWKRWLRIIQRYLIK